MRKVVFESRWEIVVAVLGSACATVNGASDKGLDNIVVRLLGGEYGLFVD